MTDWLYWFLKRFYILWFCNAQGNQMPKVEAPPIAVDEDLPAHPKSTELPIDMSGIEFEDDGWEELDE